MHYLHLLTAHPLWIRDLGEYALSLSHWTSADLDLGHISGVHSTLINDLLTFVDDSMYQVIQIESLKNNLQRL